ncbi:hypothetical protein [Microseira wollei]|nr:hypothetical protein [Microseira wollei]
MQPVLLLTLQVPQLYLAVIATSNKYSALATHCDRVGINPEE